ncbi:DUF6986 family protein [Bailinhaonella thermotolerans]|uniref:DUF6986 family protein n=1 Tax=Bailinhaonella thermotolerans TaxID=1070861 RepID=UPI001F5BF66B|nr:aldolase [Bailinhaonella thermotolerans]
MKRTLATPALAAVEAAHREQRRRFPGPPEGRQPVHTVYVPADRLTEHTVRDLGVEALRLFRAHDAAAACDVAPGLADAVRAKVEAKLRAEPVEDLRVDFEDGYGTRPDAEEDAHVLSAAGAVVRMREAGTLPRRWGLRIKSFADGAWDRGVRTLDGFLTEIVARAGQLPPGFVVTFPKVMMREYLDAFAEILADLEMGLSLPPRTLRFEIQVEAPQTVLFLLQGAPECDGRVAAAHFGVFDYTAACGLAPHEQRLDHPACDFARHVMQVAFAGTGVELSDGSSNIAPVTDADVPAVWRAHAAHVRHSLSHGFYQGWDMHPSHLVSRFTTAYAFHLAGFDAYAERVRAWRERQATDTGVMDEPATVKTLAAHLRRAAAALPG